MLGVSGADIGGIGISFLAMRLGGVANGWQHRSASRRAQRVTAIRAITLDLNDSVAPERLARPVAAAHPIMRGQARDWPVVAARPSRFADDAGQAAHLPERARGMLCAVSPEMRRDLHRVIAAVLQSK